MSFFIISNKAAKTNKFKFTGLIKDSLKLTF